MIKCILLTMTLLILTGSGLAIAQDTPGKVHNKVSKTITAESKAQEKADDWSFEKATILDDIRDLKYRITWLQYRQDKNRVYIKGVKESIKDLEFRKAEINKLREQLEPYLDEVVDRMAAFVESDLPFLPDERQTRLNALRDSLNNYNVPMSEKMRRVFVEGLQIETEYGKMIEAIEDETVCLNGADTQVTIFRLGRVDMFYMSLDGTQIGIWNQESGQWEALPKDLIRDLKQALDMAKAKRSAEIVELPLGAL